MKELWPLEENKYVKHCLPHCLFTCDLNILLFIQILKKDIHIPETMDPYVVGYLFITARTN